MTAQALAVLARADGVRFAVRVQPRASRSEVVGAAYEALIELLADRLGVAKRAVRIVTGATARSKTIEVDGIGVEAVRRLAEDSGRA